MFNLARRNFMDAVRSSGEITRGPAPLDKTDMQAFAEFDKARSPCVNAPT
jgi:uncharacterized protein YaiI (UPF0178 family)